MMRRHDVTRPARGLLLSSVTALGLAACASPEASAPAPGDAADTPRAEPPADASADGTADVTADTAVDATPDAVVDGPPDATPDVPKEPDDALRPPGWTPLSPPSAANLTAVWGTSPANVWVVGGGDGRAGSVGTVLRWGGRGWRVETLPDVAACDTYRCGLASVWGRGDREVWVAGRDAATAGGEPATVLRWDGSGWAFTNAPHATYGGWCAGTYGPGGDVWVGGLYGHVARWAGRGWSATQVEAPGGDPLAGTNNPYFRGQISALWPIAPDGMWAVGGSEGGRGAYITRWDGRAWSRSYMGSGGRPQAVWGAAPDDLWSVGMEGAILHWDGRAWASVASGTTRALYGVWGGGANDVWAVGEGGTVLHWDGRAWTPSPSGTERALHGVWGSGAGEVWAVGDGGTVLRWYPPAR